MPLRQLVLPFLCALLLHAPMLHAQSAPVSEMLQAQTDPVAGMLRQWLEGIDPDTDLNIGSCRLQSSPILPELYKRRAYTPVWTRPESVAELIAAIRESYAEGLNPQEYHLAWILNMLEGNRSGIASDPSMSASLDMLLTDAFIQLAGHTTCGREDPATHQPLWERERTLGGDDPVDFFEKGLASPSIARTIDSWKVRHPYYERLKQALAAYRSIRSNGGWQRVPEGKILKPGMSGVEVAALRRRLAAEDPQFRAEADPMRFDRGLHLAVQRFQEQHGLEPDGVAGSETLAELNVPVEYRIDQIRINLERGRWVLSELGDTFVMVDIAGFSAHFRKQGRIVWSGKVVVGQPYRNTPVLRSKVAYLEFNPPWTIPPTIRDEDVLPALVEDPLYLRKNRIMVIDGKGLVIPPETVNWSLYPAEPFPYRLVQNPGAGNPLGRIKIMFPNEHLVYLHDTPDKSLFEQDDRTLSSGCIRVESPFELAALLLDNYAGWSPERLSKAAATGLTWRINLPEPVPILLMYSTVTVDDTGTVFFKKDPYSRDPLMLKGLSLDSEISPAI